MLECAIYFIILFYSTHHFNENINAYTSEITLDSQIISSNLSCYQYKSCMTSSWVALQHGWERAFHIPFHWGCSHWRVVHSALNSPSHMRICKTLVEILCYMKYNYINYINVYLYILYKYKMKGHKFGNDMCLRDLELI